MFEQKDRVFAESKVEQGITQSVFVYQKGCGRWRLWRVGYCRYLLWPIETANEQRNKQTDKWDSVRWQPILLFFWPLLLYVTNLQTMNRKQVCEQLCTAGYWWAEIQIYKKKETALVTRCCDEVNDINQSMTSLPGTENRSEGTTWECLFVYDLTKEERRLITCGSIDTNVKTSFISNSVNQNCDVHFCPSKHSLKQNGDVNFCQLLADLMRRKETTNVKCRHNRIGLLTNQAYLIN